MEVPGYFPGSVAAPAEKWRPGTLSPLGLTGQNLIDRRRAWISPSDDFFQWNGLEDKLSGAALEEDTDCVIVYHGHAAVAPAVSFVQKELVRPCVPFVEAGLDRHHCPGAGGVAV